MARPHKQTVDYFPHSCISGKTMFTLESKYGNNGYAFWFKLLELLGSTEGHFYDYNNPADWQFLIAKTHVNEDTANDILQTLIDLNAIDKELATHKIIWCQHFIDNIADAYKRRQVDLPLKPTNRQKPYREEAKRKKGLFEVNQDYLAAHPEQALAGPQPGEEDQETEIVPGGFSVEEHEQALIEQNPHLKKFLEDNQEA